MENPTCREESLGLNSDGHTDWVTGRQVRMRARGAETTAATGGGGGSPWGRLHCCVFWGTRGSRCCAGVTWRRAPGSEPLPAWSGHRGGRTPAAPSCPAPPCGPREQGREHTGISASRELSQTVRVIMDIVPRPRFQVSLQEEKCASLPFSRFKVLIKMQGGKVA